MSIMSIKNLVRRAAVITAIAASAIGASSAWADELPYDFKPGGQMFERKAPAPLPDGYFLPESTADRGGGHPDVRLEFNLQTKKVGVAEIDVPARATREVDITLPPGFVGNPTTLGVCSMDDVLANEDQTNLMSLGRCPRTSAIGWILLRGAQAPHGNSEIPRFRRRIWRVANTNQEVAAFATSVLGIPVRMYAKVTPSSGYRVGIESRNLSQQAMLSRVAVHLWAVPAHHQEDGGPLPPDLDPEVGGTADCDGSVDPFNGSQLCIGAGLRPASRFGSPLEGVEPRPFLSNGSDCDSELSTRISLLPYGSAFGRITEDVPLDPLTDCDEQPFEPSIDVTATGADGGAPQAGQPMGLTVGITVPQTDAIDEVASAHVKDVTVTLPEGVAISPPSAIGLDACTDAELDVNGDSAPKCPDASRLGTLKIETPVLDNPVNGVAYLGEQLSSDPESGEMYRLFLVANSAGVLVKLKGAVRVDAETGQITTTFENNPQMPFSRLELKLDAGDRASLVAPECGTHAATATLTSYAGHEQNPGASFTVDHGCGKAPLAVAFQAGTEVPVAGGSSTFSLRVAREDRTKDLKTIKQIRLPEGLLGNVGSVPLCPEVQAAAGSCPDGSRIGRVATALGSGATPLWVPQASKSPTAVYLSGPYKGAPYSLSIVVPAQAGPFDLGKVVVRSALHVDERTTAITTGIDETRLINPDGTVADVLPEALPLMLKGIVLNQREIRVIMDRKDFIVNPTDCSMKQITAEIYSEDDDRVSVGNRFRAADCALLGFKPGFSAKILDKGRKSTLRSFHPRTKFTVVPRKGDANIAGARVVLPSSTLLDQANIGTTCTRAQMAERKCPEASIVGYAKAWSPLLKDTIEGPVYLAANGGVRPLPDLAAVLDGEIRVVLEGEVSTLRTGRKARLQNTFRVVPDAPVDRFELTMRGGNKTGLLVNSTDLCRTSERGVAVFEGQNGRQHKLNPRIATTFKGCAKVRRQAARRKAARKAAARNAAARRAARA